MISIKGAALAAATACVLVAAPAAAQELDALVPSASTNRITDSREHGCLTEAIYREAGSEPMRGRMAVAQVIINRTRSGTFPSTVCGVVHQRGQFNFPKGLGPRRGVAEARLWEEARSVASLAMRGVLTGLSERVLYFNSVAVRGAAARGGRLAAVIGRHAFYAPR